MGQIETSQNAICLQGITRCRFMKSGSQTAVGLGLGPALVPRIAHAIETQPHTPVIRIDGLECI